MKPISVCVLVVATVFAVVSDNAIAQQAPGSGRGWAPGAKRRVEQKAGPATRWYFTVAPLIASFGGSTASPTNSVRNWELEAETGYGLSAEVAFRAVERDAVGKGKLVIDIPLLVAAPTRDLPPDFVPVHGLIVPTLRYELATGSSFILSPGIGVGGGVVVQIGDQSYGERFDSRVRSAFALRLGVNVMFSPSLGIAVNYLRAAWKDQTGSESYWSSDPFETIVLSASVTMISAGVVFHP